jgi:hypothetical protein
MASLPGSTPLLQHSITPTEMPLDGVPLCFMLRRFSRPNRARGEVPMKMGRLRRKNALLLGLESFC